jgi:hypothetical protein
MRIGLPEIIIIIAVVIAVVVVARIVRLGRNETDGGEVSTGKPAGRTRTYLKRLGGAFIIVGVMLLLAGISFFKWALQSYGWSFALVVIGLAIFFLSRRK